MATVIIRRDRSENPGHQAARGSAAAGADQTLFRFGLRQLFMFVAGICMLLAAMASTNGLAAAALLLATTVIAMHVFATVIGSRLRSRTDEEQAIHASEPPSAEAITLALQKRKNLAAIHAAPRSPWHGRYSTYLPWLPQLIVSAMVLGGVAGALLLSGTIAHRTSAAGIVVGATSFAVLAGWVSFLCGNFYGVFRHGFREALVERQADEPPGPTQL